MYIYNIQAKLDRKIGKLLFFFNQILCTFAFTIRNSVCKIIMKVYNVAFLLQETKLNKKNKPSPIKHICLSPAFGTGSGVYLFFLLVLFFTYKILYAT